MMKLCNAVFIVSFFDPRLRGDDEVGLGSSNLGGIFCDSE